MEEVVKEEEWDAIFETKIIKGNKITIPATVMKRLSLKPGDNLRVLIKAL